MRIVTKLEPNEVFVFGSNAQGFHGAGAAGQACRGDSRNTWRSDPWFLEAMQAQVGSVKRIGKWAVFGVARGLQQGREGQSYAVETVRWPGARRSTPRGEIQSQLKDLLETANLMTGHRFLVAPLGTGYAGWTEEEMFDIWSKVFQELHWVPRNLEFLGPDPVKRFTEGQEAAGLEQL